MIKKIRIRLLAKRIYVALLANPERYKYMASLYESGEYAHDELNEKNANKAYLLAETFINFKCKQKP